MTDVVTTEQTSTVIVATPASATVSVSGVNSAIVIPPGAGATGPQGPQGEQGPEGPEGPTPEEVIFEVLGGALGTQPTFNGAPLFSGTYIKVGSLVHFQIQVDFDNITSFGSGQYYIDLPFACKHNYQFSAGCLHDISTGRDYPIFGHVFAGEVQMLLKSIDAQGNSAFNVPFAQGSPITLATADNFHLSGSYIAEDL
jgi:hypothetical protein